MRSLPLVASLLATACGAGQEPAPAPPAAETEAPGAVAPEPAAPAPAADAAPSFHRFRARTIEGKEQDFAAYDGLVVLAVNTASQCGFTPQYAGLEALWKKYKDKGVVVLGFPSNDFGGQEPGSDAEVKSFCEMRYGVTFPLFSKSVVKGDGASEIFRFLAAGGGGQPEWNFHKYLVDKHGRVVTAFASPVPPDDPSVVAAIEKQLAAP